MSLRKTGGGFRPHRRPTPPKPRMNNLPADKNRRVLVIDDNPAIHDDFRKILSPDTGATAALDRAGAELFGSTAKGISRVRYETDSAYQGAEGVQAGGAGARRRAAVRAGVRGHPHAAGRGRR